MNILLLYASPTETHVACNLPALGPASSLTLCKKSVSHGKWLAEDSARLGKPSKTIGSPTISAGPNVPLEERRNFKSCSCLGTVVLQLLLVNVLPCVPCCASLLLANLLLPDTYIVLTYTCLWLPKMWEVCSKGLLSPWNQLHKGYKWQQ